MSKVKTVFLDFKINYLRLVSLQISLWSLYWNNCSRSQGVKKKKRKKILFSEWKQIHVAGLEYLIHHVTTFRFIQCYHWNHDRLKRAPSLAAIIINDIYVWMHQHRAGFSAESAFLLIICMFLKRPEHIIFDFFVVVAFFSILTYFDSLTLWIHLICPIYISEYRLNDKHLCTNTVEQLCYYSMQSVDCLWKPIELKQHVCFVLMLFASKFGHNNNNSTEKHHSPSLSKK